MSLNLFLDLINQDGITIPIALNCLGGLNVIMYVKQIAASHIVGTQ